MTARQRAHDRGLQPHYKVRIVLSGAILHLACFEEPEHVDEWTWKADWIDHPEYGDTVGYIDWSKVTAITWRWCE